MRRTFLLLVGAIAAGASLTSVAQLVGAPAPPPGGLGPPVGPADGRAGVVGPAAPGAGQPKVLQPYIRMRETLTSNANLGSGSSARSDWITELGAGLRINFRAPRLTAFGDIGLAQYIYAGRTQKNATTPRVTLQSVWEAVDRTLFLDTAINSYRTFDSAFSFQPTDRALGGDNAITLSTLRVSPYLTGQLGRARYLLRDDNTWVKSSGTNNALALRDSYQNLLTGQVAVSPTPFGWDLTYNHSETKYDSQPALSSDITRGRAIYQANNELQVYLTAGHESNQFYLQTVSGAVYGGGTVWRPGPRTTLNANYEHRYFGPSHRLSFAHRMRLLSLSLNSSRDVYTIPQLASTIPVGVDLRALLDSIFAADPRYSDPIVRAAVVDAYMLANNLPRTLTTVSYSYAPVITLRSSQSATLAAIGAQSSLAFTLYTARSEPISSDTGSLIPVQNPLLFNRQRGASLVYNNRLTAQTRGNAALFVVNTTGLEGVGPRTRQRSLTLTLDHRYTASTNLVAGARYQRFMSVGAPDTDEYAVFAGFDHRF